MQSESTNLWFIRGRFVPAQCGEKVCSACLEYTLNTTYLRYSRYLLGHFIVVTDPFPLVAAKRFPNFAGYMETFLLRQTREARAIHCRSDTSCCGTLFLSLEVYDRSKNHENHAMLQDHLNVDLCAAPMWPCLYDFVARVANLRFADSPNFRKLCGADDISEGSTYLDVRDWPDNNCFRRLPIVRQLS